MDETRIELVQWRCTQCGIFEEGRSLERPQEHFDAYGHVVEATVTKTVIETITIGPS